MSREWGSNPRPTVYDTVALPTELSRRMNGIELSLSAWEADTITII